VEPLRFISEPVDPVHDERRGPEKRLGCPDGFVWRGQEYRVAELVREWHDYTRRGKMAHNMRPWHAEAAASRGSWGVGRDYYLVRTAEGRIFELYYDRAPTDAGGRSGGWFLFREMVE
jgi:hypothetical protein